MNEHPILFTTDMVRAILKGEKTQTRRIIRPQPIDWCTRVEPAPFKDGNCICGRDGEWLQMTMDTSTIRNLGKCPYGVPGDYLWVRETWRNQPLSFNQISKEYGNFEIQYRADFSREEDACYGRRGGLTPWKWRPSIFMPRRASRITLIVIDIRAERVQDISLQNIVSEGINDQFLAYDGASEDQLKELAFSQYKVTFQKLWNSINAKRGYGWDMNPWVWVINFNLFSIIDDPMSPGRSHE